MARFLLRSALTLAVLCSVSEVWAGGRYTVVSSYPYAPAYGYHYAPAYGYPYAPVYVAHPYLNLSTPYVPTIPAAPVSGTGNPRGVPSDHTLVSRTASNGAQYYDVYHPQFGFMGWAQVINGALQFFQNSGLGGLIGQNNVQGGGGILGSDIQILSQVTTLVNNFLNQYTSDITAIKSLLADLKKTPTGAPAGGNSDLGNQDTLDQIVNRLKALKLDNTATTTNNTSKTINTSNSATHLDNTPP
jgi:hypothetical protein